MLRVTFLNHDFITNEHNPTQKCCTGTYRVSTFQTWLRGLTFAHSLDNFRQTAFIRESTTTTINTAHLWGWAAHKYTEWKKKDSPTIEGMIKAQQL